MNCHVPSQKRARDAYNKKKERTICEAKTKALISCAGTAQLICAFVFAYAKSRFYWVMIMFDVVTDTYA